MIGDRSLELTPSRESTVGALRVRRALPTRGRRTVGAWCFADHMGPVAVSEERGVDVGPHPHTGLQTVTWIVAGEVLHRDSLGSEQVIRPGQLNLMSAGHGVSHSEEATGRYRGSLHGIQLWIAQPESTRHAPAAFEHHAVLPAVELDETAATVLIGSFAGVTSPARRDSDLVGVELDISAGAAVVPLEPRYEHALVVLDGAVAVDGQVVPPGVLAYLGAARDEIGLTSADRARVMLLGGAPWSEPPLFMWWNFVARSSGEIDEATSSWQHDDGRFGIVRSPLARIPAPAPPWSVRR